MNTKPTSDLIQSFSSMTRYRDHVLVDVALCQSLAELFRNRHKRFSVRLFRVTRTEGRSLYSLNAWTEDNKILAEECDVPEAEVPPAVVDAVQYHAMHFAETRISSRTTDYLAWLPVVHGDDVLAVLEMRRSRPLRHGDLTLASAMLGLYSNYLSLLHYSETDTLTRLLNRKTFEESLRKLLLGEESLASDRVDVERRAPAREGAHWLAVMDIDHFKLVNDRFGHLFGDEVLILVADEMRRTFRRSDRLFRFGGEEFVVLLRNVAAEHVPGIFERFRGNIAARNFPQVGQVTISIGATEILAADNPTTVLGRADDALYYAKEHGRNQVRFYEKLVSEGQLANHQPEMSVDLF